MVAPEAEEVAAFRASCRASEIGPSYAGWAHFAFTAVGALGALTLALLKLENVRTSEWPTVPIAFLIANFGEYFGHRFPMHHSTPGLRALFERHALRHHRFYTRNAMAAESPRDFKMVLFPPVMLLFFLGGMASPIALFAFLVFSPNTGWLFLAVAVGYFLTYEGLHFAYHLPETTGFGRLPGIALLRKHHAHHHDRALMQRWNFNITFPIADCVLGTLYRVRRGGESDHDGGARAR